MSKQDASPVKQQRGRDTVARLLDAALQVYAELGPQDFAMAPVLERSGVSVGSLYHHFGSLDGLARALFHDCITDFMTTLAGSLHGKRTARTGVHALVTTYLTWSATNRTRAMVIHTSPQYSGRLADIAALRDRQSPILTAIAQWFTPHVAAGRVQSLAPGLLEALVSAPPAHVVRMWLLDPTAVDLNLAIRQLPEQVWQSLRGPNADH